MCAPKSRQLFVSLSRVHTAVTPAADRAREWIGKGPALSAKNLPVYAAVCTTIFPSHTEPELVYEHEHEHVSHASSCFHSPLVGSWHCVGKTKAHCFGSHREFSFDFLDFYALAASYLWPGIEMRHAEMRESEWESESKSRQGLIVPMPLLKRSKRQDTS